MLRNATFVADLGTLTYNNTTLEKVRDCREEYEAFFGKHLITMDLPNHMHRSMWLLVFQIDDESDLKFKREWITRQLRLNEPMTDAPELEVLNSFHLDLDNNICICDFVVCNSCSALFCRPEISKNKLKNCKVCSTEFGD